MKTILIIAAVLLLVAGAAKSQLVGRIAGVEHVAEAIAPVAIPASLEQSQEAGPEVKLVLLALRPEGFESSELQVEPGD